MISIIDYFKLNRINFTVSSLSANDPSTGPYNVLDTTANYFISKTTPTGQWWQLTFPTPVYLSSYTIGDNNEAPNWITKWKISYSNNEEDFIHIRDESHPDIRGNDASFRLNPNIALKTFRITYLENTAKNNHLHFSYFNCFGTVNSNKKRKRNTCNFIVYKYKLISKLLTMIYISTIGS